MRRAVLTLCAAACGLGAAERSNVVVILADDLGWGSLGCYGANAELLRTPNLDRLAAEGRRFTDATTPASLCTPTRYGLLTGRACWRTHLKRGVLSSAPALIEDDRPTLASLAAGLGYRTAAIGKWHLGYGDQPKPDLTAPFARGPLSVGFQHAFQVPSNHGDRENIWMEGHAIHGLRSTTLKPYGTGYYSDKPYHGYDAPQREDRSVESMLAGKAADWIAAQRADAPFFLYYAPVAVHEPITPSASFAGTSRAGAYAEWIMELDTSVGRVLDALDRGGFSRNTLVLFTSDNGGVTKAWPKLDGHIQRARRAGLAINGPWAGTKSGVQEGGFRVPYLVRWPGRVPAGSTETSPVNVIDTLASVVACLGASLPAGASPDGIDVSPAWLGTAPSPRQQSILHGGDGTFILRSGRWKWIEGVPAPDPKSSRSEHVQPALYDLVADPAETRDLRSAHPAIANELQRRLAAARSAESSADLIRAAPLP